MALGFSLDAAVAEYRALRASVTRLWQKSLCNQPLSNTHIAELIRFNEAVDQSINESVTSYTFEKEQQMRVFDTILSSLPGISFTSTLDGRFSYVNKAMAELLNMSSDDLVGKNFLDIGMPNGSDLQHQISLAVSTKKQIQGELSYTGPTGKCLYYDYVFVPAFDKNGLVEAVAGTAHDITERKKMEDQNWQKANYDQLTKLPNRRYFLDRLEQEVKHASRIGRQTTLLFIDLDHFKEANDQFGHDTGDQLLQLVTGRLCLCVRDTDMVARLGGDEFTIILQDFADTKYVEFVAEKILTELAKPFQILEHIVYISASIGIALCPHDANTSEALLTQADQAMYMAKNAGRNQFSFFIPQPPQPSPALPGYDGMRIPHQTGH